jgi:DNA-binding transcriptional LysR family regulator
VELRQLQAFEAVATELHFGRAAQRLFTSQPAISEQVRRLEQELGTPLLRRTSRRVELTPAGVELLTRARAILADAREAAAAVRLLSEGAAGTLHVGVTPPAAPVLAPHLIAACAARSPGIVIEMCQMWLPGLYTALVEGRIDCAITAGRAGAPAGIESRHVAREPLLVGLRPSHRLAGRGALDLAELQHEVLGQSADALFPAWVHAQRAVLAAAGIDPPTTTLAAADLSAAHWSDQGDVDWILLTPSLTPSHRATTFIPLSPAHHVDFTLLWPRTRTGEPALARFLESCATAEPPEGWARPARTGGGPP